MRVADVDGNGLADVAIMNNTDIYALMQNATGVPFSYRYLIQHGTTSYHSGFRFADWDQDGNLEIVVSSGFTILLFRKEGGEEYTKHIFYGEVFGEYIGEFLLADYNKDSYPDIMTLRYYDEALVLFENDQEGGKKDREVFVSHLVDSAVQSFDMDQDGDDDVLAVGNLSFYGRASVFTQQHAHAFSEPVFLEKVFPGIHTLLRSDINKDGREDLVVGYWFEDYISVYTNFVEGGFSGEDIQIPVPEQIRGLVEADMNHDGLSDLVPRYNYQGKSLDWIENLGGGRFERRTIIPFINEVSSLVVVDWNRDGKEDILLTVSNQLYRFDTQGGGVLGMGTGIVIHAVEDMDGDSRPDLVVSTASNFRRFSDYYARAFQTMLWLNKENGIQKKEIDLRHIESEYVLRPKILVVDIDLDSDKDVLIDTDDYRQVYWKFNDGMGAFTRESNRISNPLSARAQFMGEDMDGDGDTDIFLYGDEGLVFLKNQCGTCRLVDMAKIEEGMQLVFPTWEHLNYYVDFSTSLVEDTWVPLPGGPFNEGVAEDCDLTEPIKFYRVRSESP